MYIHTITSCSYSDHVGPHIHTYINAYIHAGCELAGHTYIHTYTQIVNTPTVVRTIAVDNHVPMGVKFSPDGQKIACAFNEGKLFIWKADSGKFHIDMMRLAEKLAVVTWFSTVFQQ